MLILTCYMVCGCEAIVILVLLLHCMQDFTVYICQGHVSPSTVFQYNPTYPLAAHGPEN